VNIQDLLRVFQRYWALIVLLVAVGLSTSAVMLLVVIQPSYEATARLFVSTQSLGTADELLQGSTYTQARMTSYAQIASDPIVLDPVIEKLQLDRTADELSSQVEASAERDQLIIEIVVTDHDPALAANIVNEVAEVLSAVITDKIEAPVAGSEAMVNVTTLRLADPPSAPSWPVPWIVITVGGLLGLIVGVGLAFLLQSSDSRVRNIEEVRKIVPYPILGLVMRERKLTSQDVTERFAHQGMFAEAYRSTRTNLQFVDAEGVQRRVLLITSSVPEEGKSTSTLSLALSLAEAGHRVALIDADLRKPCVAEMLGLEDSLGLTDLLVNRVGLEDVMQSVGDNRRLWVLPSGRVPPNPAELLGSPQFEELLTRFKNLFDYVIIDSPPVLPVSDAIVLSRSVDGVLLVAAIETVRRPQLETCVQTLERVGAPVIGVIANRLARTGVDAYSYYGDKAYQSSLAVSTEPAEEPFQSKSSNTESGGSGGREESDAPRSRKRAAREAS